MLDVRLLTGGCLLEAKPGVADLEPHALGARLANNMDRFAQLNTYHMTKFAYFLEKLKATPDGDGTLLDHSLVLYGSSLSDGNQHNFSPLPIVLAGGASGKLQGGRHLRFPKDTHMSNLLLAMLEKIGAKVGTFGDSTEMLSV